MKKILLLVAAVAAGCTAVGPDYERPEIALPGQFDAAANQDGLKIPADWWKLYGDPALDEIVAATRANNADMRFAVARVQEAEGVLREASRPARAASPVRDSRPQKSIS